MQEHVLASIASLARKNAALDRSAVGDGLVRVDASVGRLAVEVVLEQRLDLGDARGAADEHDLVNLVLLEAGVRHDLADGAERLLEEVVVELLKAGAGQRLGEVDAVEEGLDLGAGLGLRGEGALDALRLAAELLHGALVLGHVDLVLLLEELDEVLHDALVKVLTAKVGITVGCEDLKDAVVNGEQRHIEGAAAKIEHEDVLLASLLVKPVRDGRGGGLVDDAVDLHARDGASVLGGLTLGVVEVGWDGDDSVLDLLVEVPLGRGAHFLEDHRRDLLWGEGLLLAVDVDLDKRLALFVDELKREQLLVRLHSLVLEVAADKALDVEHGVLRVDGGLVLGRVADKALAVLGGPCDVGWGDAVTLVVGNDLDIAVLEHTDARVRGAEVDADGGADGFVVFVVVVLRAHHGARDGQGQGGEH